MKVLYIASGTGMAGGATKSFIPMLLEARNHGVEVEVVCPDDKGLTQWLKENKIKVHVVPYRHARLPYFNTFIEKIKWLPRLVHDYWINLRGKTAVKKIAEKFGPDIIHENTSVINVGYYASKAIGVPDVIHIREYGYPMILPGRMKRLRNKNIFTISITKDIRRSLGLDSSERGTQIYDGMVSSADFRLNTEKERWFLYAGRIELTKGIGDLFEAYVEYATEIENPFPLYICGGCNDNEYLESLKKLVAENGLDSKVIWMGERDDIADYMYRTAATIVPSRVEGLGRVMPEAMTNGSLCIGYYTMGTKEQIDNGLEFTGAPIAISYTEKEQLKDALTKITKEYDNGTAFLPASDYMQMIGRAQNAVKEFFSVESFGKKVMDFYERVLTSRQTS